MPVRSLSQPVQVCLLALICTVPCGCVSVAGLQDLHFSCCNKYRASEAWKCNFTKDQRKACTEDFEHGFKAGYYDTAMGKDCRLPPVAPPRYWSARYQSCAGQCAVQEWFRGYQTGIAAAQSSHCPSFSEVPVSPGAPVLNKTGCGTCYSPDPCKCNAHHGESGECIENTIPIESHPIHSEPEEVGHEMHGASIDLPDSRAIVPASFGTSAGLIGGFGVKTQD